VSRVVFDSCSLSITELNAAENRILTILDSLSWRRLLSRAALVKVPVLPLWIALYKNDQFEAAFSLSQWSSARNLLDLYRTVILLADTIKSESGVQITLLKESEVTRECGESCLQYHLTDDRGLSQEIFYCWKKQQLLSEEEEIKIQSTRALPAELTFEIDAEILSKGSIELSPDSLGLIRTSLGAFQVEHSFRENHFFIQTGVQMDKDEINQKIEVQLVLGGIELTLEELISLRKGLTFKVECIEQHRGILRVGNLDWAEVSMTFDKDSIQLEVVELVGDLQDQVGVVV